MPIYQMSLTEGDPNHLDYATRQLLNDKELNPTKAMDDRFWIGLFFVVVIFMLGVVVGSALHDSLFHALEAGAK